MSLYLPKRSTVTLDGENTGDHAGYHIVPVAKGKHSILVEPLNRRLSPEDLAGSPDP